MALLEKLKGRGKRARTVNGDLASDGVIRCAFVGFGSRK
jgi:hypothetical protein